MGYKRFLIVFNFGDMGRYRYIVTLQAEEDIEDIVKRAREFHQQRYLKILNNPENEDLIDREVMEGIIYPINSSILIEEITDVTEIKEEVNARRG